MTWKSYDRRRNVSPFLEQAREVKEILIGMELKHLLEYVCN